MENERIKLLDDLNQDVIFIKKQFGYIFLILNFFKKIVQPILFLLKLLRRFILLFLNKIFNILIQFKMIRKLINSRILTVLVYFVSRFLFFDQLRLKFEKIKMRSRKKDLFESREIRSNNKLLAHYKNSKGAQLIQEVLNNKSRRG